MLIKKLKIMMKKLDGHRWEEKKKGAEEASAKITITSKTPPKSEKIKADRNNSSHRWLSKNLVTPL